MIGDSDTHNPEGCCPAFGFTVWTLRAEADRGRLTIYKIGKRFYTTPADIKEMIQLCASIKRAATLP